MNYKYSPKTTTATTDGKVDAMKKTDKDKVGPVSIHTFEKREQPTAPTKTQGPRFKLYKRITKLFNKYQSLVGEGYLPKGAAGIHYRQSGNIRLQGMNDVSVAAHELTHRLDFINGIIESLMVGDAQLNKTLQQMLTAIYTQYYPQGKKDHPLGTRMKEGYATLLQKYTEHPSTIQNEYPELVKEFLKKGGEFYKPQIGELIEDLRQIVTDFQGLSAIQRIEQRLPLT